MSMEIDFKKLVEQEPEFAEFCKTVTFKIFTETQPQIIGMLHAMYSSGMDPDAVVQTFKMMMLFGEGGKGNGPRNNS